MHNRSIVKENTTEKKKTTARESVKKVQAQAQLLVAVGSLTSLDPYTLPGRKSILKSPTPVTQHEFEEES